MLRKKYIDNIKTKYSRHISNVNCQLQILKELAILSLRLENTNIFDSITAPDYKTHWEVGYYNQFQENAHLLTQCKPPPNWEKKLDTKRMRVLFVYLQLL